MCYGSVTLFWSRWVEKKFGERRAGKMVVVRVRGFNQKVGAKISQQANLVCGLNQVIGRMPTQPRTARR